MRPEYTGGERRAQVRGGYSYPMNKRGVSAVEVMVAVMVGAAVTIPILALLNQERDTEQRSRYEYLAVLAARDEMYQARMLVGLGTDPAQVAHAARKVTGNPVDGIGNLYEGAKPGSVYPAEMERVTVELTIDAAAGSRVRPAKATARWMDPALAATPGQAGRKTDVEVYFGVLRPPWVTP